MELEGFREETVHVLVLAQVKKYEYKSTADAGTVEVHLHLTGFKVYGHTLQYQILVESTVVLKYQKAKP